MENFMIVIIFIILLLIVGIIVIFNNCISLQNKVKQSKSSIDIYLTQRFDLIPNLVECVKGYKNYEERTLEAITELRSAYDNNKSLQTGSQLAEKMNTLIAIAEENADLQASEQFLILQRNLTKVESQLQAARRIYNGDVTLYNTAIQTFPNNIIARWLKLKEEELFIIEEYKAQNIEVKI